MPRAVRALYPWRIWRIPSHSSYLYPSFDDGPMPGVTERILEVLKDFDAKATFFCTGRNAERYPHLMEKVLEAGHGIGNHGYDHLNGRKHPRAEYVADVHRASRVIPSPLFRPPYGRLKWKQARSLSRHFRIVMWDVLSGDFDQRLNARTCTEKVFRYALPGSILLFHDSEKASERVEKALPTLLERFSERGFDFAPIPGSRSFIEAGLSQKS